MTPNHTTKADGKPASKGYCGPRYILERWQKGECESRADGIRDYVYYSIMEAKRYGRGYHKPTHSIARLFDCSQQSVRRAVKSSNVITRQNNAWILKSEGKVSDTRAVPELEKGEGLVGPIPRGLVCPQKGPSMPSISNSTGGLLGPINSSKPLESNPLAKTHTPLLKEIPLISPTLKDYKNRPPNGGSETSKEGHVEDMPVDVPKDAPKDSRPANVIAITGSFSAMYSIRFTDAGTYSIRPIDDDIACRLARNYPDWDIYDWAYQVIEFYDSLDDNPPRLSDFAKWHCNNVYGHYDVDVENEKDRLRLDNVSVDELIRSPMGVQL